MNECMNRRIPWMVDWIYNWLYKYIKWIEIWIIKWKKNEQMIEKRIDSWILMLTNE